MSAKERKFVIAGAGIAGLSLALALAKFGASVTVIERQERIQEFGAGLQIGPNARRILDRLGASRYVLPRIHCPDAIDVFAFQGKKPFVSMELGAVMQERFGAPYGVMHRADLAEALHQACKRFATIDILFGVKNVDFEHHARGFTVMIEEKDGRSRVLRPFAYIGADGVHSATRTVLMDGPAARYTGYTAWRALMSLDRLPEALSRSNTSLIFGPGFHAVVYPLPFRGVANLALTTRIGEKQALRARERRKFVAPRELKFSKLFSALVESAEYLTPWPLYGVSTNKWHDDVVGLVGDAAHAMLPFQAQGAAMGIEDAAVLAPLLIANADPQSAFESFFRHRRGRVARMARTSRMNGHIFHLPWPIDYARNIAVWQQGARAHLKRLAWIYSYDPAPEPASIPLRPDE